MLLFFFPPIPDPVTPPNPPLPPPIPAASEHGGDIRSTRGEHRDALDDEGIKILYGKLKT